jgi:hypothetical protein
MTQHSKIGILAGRFHDQIIEIDRILHFSLAGIKGQIRAPQAVEALANYEKIKGELA